MTADLWGALDVRGYEFARFLLSLLWQSSILLSGVAALAFLLRRQPARVRHALWVAGLLCVPLLPLISWAGSKAGTLQRQVAVIPHYRAQFAPMSEPAHPALPTRSAESPDETSAAPVSSLERQAPIPAPHLEPRAAASTPLQPKQRAPIYLWVWGMAAYAVAAAALLAWVLLGWLGIRRRMQKGRILSDARVAGILASAQDQTGVRAPVAVIESEAVPIPLTIRTFRPVILAPRGLLALLSDEDVRALLVHELAHIRRRDAPTLMLVSLLRAVFFFQPLAWIAARRISILAEHAADDIVLEAIGQPVAYAKTLARLAETLPRHAIGVELSAGFLFSRGAVLSRVRAILADRARVRNFSRWTLVGTVAAVAIAIGIACAVPVGEKRAAIVTEDPALRVAADILKNHFIRDAVMIVPNGTWHSAPALADIAGDGTLQVIAPVGEGWVGAWHCDGRPVAGWPQECGRICCPVAVGDVFHDGKLEIASPGHLWRADGQLVPGWPQGRGNEFCAPSLADLFGDGHLEILSTDIQLGVCVRRGDGTILPGWPIAVPDNDVRSTPQAFDLLGDGKKEIIFTRPEGEVRVYTLDGKAFPGFPKRFSGISQQSFVLTSTGNLVCGGSVIDLLKGTTTQLAGESGGEAPCLLTSTATGQLTSVAPWIPSRRRTNPAGEVSDGPGDYSDSAVAADIDGDGNVEVLFGNREGGYHAVRKNGTEAPGWPKFLTPSGDSGMAVGNLVGDTLQVVVNADGGRIYVFDEPGSAGSVMPWPTFLANNLRNGMPDLQRRPRAPAHPLSAKAEELKKALSKGDWDATIALYHDAMLTVKQNAANFGVPQAAQMQQAGLLSIARVLNTRAKRFDEAAAQYQEAIAAAPKTWSACQALVECTDLVRLHPKLAGARSSLQRAVAAYLPVLDHLTGENADLCRYAAAQACTLLDQPEGGTLFQSIANNFLAEPCLASMVKSFAEYDGLPFLLNLSERHWHSLEVKTKDLTPESKVEAQIQVLLEVDPNSPTSEAFPMTLRLKAPADQAALLGADWKAGEDGQLHREVERDLPSAPLGTFRGQRELLFSVREPEDWLTVRREVTRVDDRHMHFKVFFQESVLKQVEFGFMTYGTGARIDPSSVSPTGAVFNNEGEVRFDSGGAERNGMSLADGITVEANIELPAGMKFFYPQIQVRAWGDHEEIQVEPRTATESVRGQVEKIEYELSSKRRFKVISATKDNIYWSFTLAKLDANDVAQASPAASIPAAGANNANKPPANAASASVQRAQVQRVDLPNATDADLAALKDVQQIMSLNLMDSKITDAGLARLEEMTGLRELYLTRCENITDAGLVHLEKLENLRILFLLGTRITDAGLASLKNLVKMQRLRLDGCTQLTNAGLANLKGMKGLLEINLMSSQVTDDGLAQFADMKDLEAVELAYCKGITDSGLAHVRTMKKLKTLYLDGTQVTDAGLAELKEVKGLESLCLRGTQVTDAGLVHLKDMRQMWVLDLADLKGVTDAGMVNLKEMRRLYTLYLEGTQVTDAGLENLRELTSLDWLHLSRTHTTDAGLANLKGLTMLGGLRLEGCTEVTDAGLTNLKDMKKLRVLDLGGCNKITGAGLANLKGMSSLVDLSLNNCSQLSDSALPYLKGLRQLQQLDLRGTAITATALAELRTALPKTNILADQAGQASAASANEQRAQGQNVDLRDGTDADLAALKNVNEIKSLWISGRNVTDAGLARLEEMPNLERVNLGYCYNITDAGLAHLKPLNKLRYLFIFGARITDAGLANLKDLPQLEDLNLDGCSHITDAGLSCLAGMKRLDSIGLGRTQVTDEALAQLAKRTNLVSLLLRFTNVTDAGLAYIKKFQLQVLDLSHCKGITDAGLANLKDMNSLYKLFLSGTATTDAGLANLKGLVMMYGLSLDECAGLTDAGLANLKGMKKLGSLNLSGCSKITDAGLANLKDKVMMDGLWLGGCVEVTDAGLANLKEMNKMRVLNLGGCPKLTDEGLANLKEMSNLQFLELAGCGQITDAGLSSLKELKRLGQLDLRGTKVTAAGAARLKAALPQARIESGDMPPQPPRQATPPAAVTKALSAEWPDADIRGVNQMDNYPGWEPKKVWRAIVVAKPESSTQVAVTDAGLVTRVVTNLNGPDASQTLPKTVADAVAAAVPGGKCDFGTRVEMRTDRMMTKLPKPAVTYLLQVTGSDTIAGLSLSEDGQLVKTVWKTPPAVFSAAKSEFPEGLAMVRPTRVPSASGFSAAGWQAVGRTDNYKWALITETGDVVKVTTQYRYTMTNKERGLPSGIPEAVAAAVPEWKNGFSSFSKTEERFDENMVRLDHPRVTYLFFTQSWQTTVTEGGVVTQIQKRSPNAIGEMPKAIADSVAAACPGATVLHVNSTETRVDEKMATLAKPKVAYSVQLQAADGKSSIYVNLNEDGAVTSLDAILVEPQLPKKVADAVTAAVPGGTIVTAIRSELRLVSKIRKLPNPCYRVAVSDGDRTVTLVLGEDGKIAEEYALPVWNVPGW